MQQIGYDIKRSAVLAANHYCAFLDEKMNGIPYFYLMVDREKEETCGVHCEWDFGDATGRYLDALLLCSELTGKDDKIEQGIARLYHALTEMLCPEDGLCYRPAGYEWVLNAADSFDQRSCLLGLATYYKHYREESTYKLVEKLIQGLYQMGIVYDDYFFIPVTDYQKDMDRALFETRPFSIADYQADPCHYGGGVIIYPLMYWYSLTGSEAALTLAGKLSRFIVYHSTVFAEDGSFYILGNGVDSDGHFHSRVDSAAGVLAYALATENEELQRFSRRVYDWAVTQGTRYGLFPEGLGGAILTGKPEEYPDVSRHSETCCTTDMIELALTLGAHCSPDYYDHAERYLNHLMAAQLVDISWIPPSPKKEDSELYTYRDVANRYRGAFTGRTTVNDFTNFGRYDTMGCCAAAGGRGISLLWSHAAVLGQCGKSSSPDAPEGETLLVNLLMNCDNPLVHIRQQADDSIMIQAKAAVSTLRIRIPQWLKEDCDSVVFTDEDGEKLEGVFVEDGYFVLESSPKVVLMRTTARETVDRQMFCGEEYQVTWKQNRVISVTPEGAFMPLYNQLT